jgi:hypothetical protein
MKGYLAIREGDILCIPENNTGIAKHMANLVKHDFFFKEFFNTFVY